MAPNEPLGLRQSLESRKDRATLRSLTTSPPDAVDFSSNDFLSLATSLELRQIFLDELHNEPAFAQNLGSGGSRLLDGNSTYAEQLEEEIAAFHGAPTGLLVNSGFDANVGLFSCLPQPGDIVIYDELIHASVHDGMRLSRASRLLKFAHNDPDSFGEVLQSCLNDDVDVRNGEKNVFVAVEAAYSMDGDTAPLCQISQLLSSMPHRNGHLIVDEAHATGVFGRQGRGLVCQLGLEDQVTVRLHTFGKALACSGAILLCSPLIRQYLINYARPLIYTTFMSYPSLAAIKASYTFLQTTTAESLIRDLRSLTGYLHDRLIELEGSVQLPAHQRHLLSVPCNPTPSAIFYVKSSRSRALAAYCRVNGFVVRAIAPPTVPPGTERIRICIHAGNTNAQIEGFVGTIEAWVRQQYDSRTAEISKSRL